MKVSQVKSIIFIQTSAQYSVVIKETSKILQINWKFLEEQETPLHNPRHDHILIIVLARPFQKGYGWTAEDEEKIELISIWGTSK